MGNTPSFFSPNDDPTTWFIAVDSFYRPFNVYFRILMPGKKKYSEKWYKWSPNMKPHNKSASIEPAYVQWLQNVMTVWYGIYFSKFTFGSGSVQSVEKKIGAADIESIEMPFGGQCL